MLHTPVLLNETIAMLNIRPDGTYIDATLGFGGHSAAIVSQLNSQGRLVAFEVDQSVYDQTATRLAIHKNVSLFRGHFVDGFEFCLSLGINKVDGILFDLGTNIVQITDAVRGFSFAHDAYLDMRLDPSSGMPAAQLLADMNEDEIVEMLRSVGETFARPIARSIVKEREKSPIETTFQLNSAIEKVKQRRSRIHPATLTYMALRIAVNQEYDAIERALPKAVEMLKSGGRLAVITFHSVEDRLVKNIFKNMVANGEITLVNKKVIKPTREEVVKNPPSRSAKLRVIEKL